MAWRLLCGSSEGCADVLHGVTTMEMLEVVEHPHAKGGSSDQAGWCGLAGSCPTVSVGDSYILQSRHMFHADSISEKYPRFSG
ncbi:unnamed protein product [Plutella xylostella]|uniref:(diamondback moth) hypothetical protein n=1 Tax=Plutella xylostella TaxID=51655 RepID=A0A8S4E1L5_PLUXY|nr:unnamed protein product [Plutella xylostella]